MADLTDIQAAQSVKVAGANSSGIESNYLQVDASGRITVKLNDAAGNGLTSQVNGTQRPLDVGINVSGVQIDPRAASPGTLTDHSGTATTTASTLMAANSNRKYLFIQNLGVQIIWINFTTTAVVGIPSIRLSSGDIFTQENSFVSTEAISVIASAGNQDYTAKEG